MRLNFIVPAGVALVLAPAFAQENPTIPIAPGRALAQLNPTVEPEISLETLLGLAAKNNPRPQIAGANLEAARARAASLRGLPGPVLQVVPGFGGTRESRDEEIILSQPLDVFGQRRANRAVLGAQTRVAEAEATLATRNLQIEVKTAAAQLFAAQESENLGAAQVEVAQKFRDATARKAELGDVPAVQVERAGLELARAQNELELARAERLARRAVLNQLVGQAPETPLRVALPASSFLSDFLRASAPLASQNAGVANPYPFAAPGSSDVGASAQIGANLVADRAQILPQALATRPDLLGAQATLDASRASVQLLGRARLPQIELQARRGGVFDSASTSLRAVINVPLFDGNLSNQKKAARAEVRAQELQVALLRSQIAAQVEGALVRVQGQRATVQRYRNSIVPLALELLRKTQIGYAQGASTYLEVLEAQRAARQVQTEYLQALVGARTSEAALESAFGSDLSLVPTGALQNPTGAARPDGVAAPGNLPANTLPPVPTQPLNPPPANLPAPGAAAPNGLNP